MLEPWLQPVFKQVLKASENATLGHALLVHGAPGWGESQLANAIAGHFIGFDPAGVDVNQFAHPDFFILKPEEAGKQIKVDQVRALRNFAMQTCQMAHKKVALIHQAHCMNQNAANALLKTLEEPPGECLLVLATDAYQDLLPTIRSRCLSLPIHAVHNVENINWLKAALEDTCPENPQSAQDLENLLFEFGKAPISVLNAVKLEQNSILPNLVSVSTESATISTLVQSWTKQNVDMLLSRWMRYVVALLREQSVTEQTDASLTPLLNQFRDTPRVQLLGFWDELAWARRLVHSTSNTNQNLLLERLLFLWCALK